MLLTGLGFAKEFSGLGDRSQKEPQARVRSTPRRFELGRQENLGATKPLPAWRPRRLQFRLPDWAMGQSVKE